MGNEQILSDDPVEIVPEDATVLAFYRDHPQRTLKTLICRAYWPTSKDYVALVTRGDLRVDFGKVTRALGLKNLRLANPDEMKKLGMETGYVSPIDCVEMRVIVDPAVEHFDTYFDGANKPQSYRKNVNYPRDFVAWKVLDFSEH